MFDAATTELIRSAPALTGVNPSSLPLELTRIYTELVTLRLRATNYRGHADQVQRLRRLKRIADIYEGIVDSGTEGKATRAAAFVAATAHQILARALFDTYEGGQSLLKADAIHPSIAAPLLFLVAEQNADAREAARPLQNVRSDNLLRSAVIESVYDLATERFADILARATQLHRAHVSTEAPWESSAADALYGLCWSGIVQLVAQLLGRDTPELEFARFELPQAVFDQVVSLSTAEVELELPGAPLVSTFGGPRHLARLLRHVANGLNI